MRKIKHQSNGIVVKHTDVAMFTATSILSNTKRNDYFFVVSFDFNLNLSATSILSNSKREEHFFVVSFDFNLNLSATVNC